MIKLYQIDKDLKYKIIYYKTICKYQKNGIVSYKINYIIILKEINKDKHKLCYKLNKVKFQIYRMNINQIYKIILE